MAATFGLVLDPWQEDVLRAGMGEQRNGLWAARYVGVSCPRQNGKSLLLLARALAGVLLFDERKVIISAHQQGTARETFDRFVDLWEDSPALGARVSQVISALNREEIRFTNGSKIQFKARQGATGRGFSADCLLLDEAQILGARQWASINSTMSARSNPQAWLFGTPPTPEDDSEVFTRFRSSAIAGKAENFAWLEWSSDGDPALEETRANANPAWYTRINHEIVQGEYETYSSEQFARERCGLWDDETSTGVVDMADWTACVGALELMSAPVVLALETSQDRRSTVLLAVGRRPDGLPQVEVLPWKSGGPAERGPGTAWVPDRVAEIVAGNEDIEVVAVDSFGAAHSLLPVVNERLVPVTVGRRLEVIETNGSQYVTACGLLFDAIRDHSLRHGGGPVLTASVKAALKRDRDGVWVWDRRRMGEAGSPLIAMTLALGTWIELSDYDVMASVLL